MDAAPPFPANAPFTTAGGPYSVRFGAAGASSAQFAVQRASPMTDGPTREEVELRLDVIAAQTDAKFERVLGEMRNANTAVIGHLNVLGTQLDAVKEIASEARSAARFTRWQVWATALTALASAVAIVALLLANTGAIASLVQTVVAVKH